MRFQHATALLICACLMVVLASCGGNTISPATTDLAPGQQPAPVETAWPASLPVDAPQPWEVLDASGRIAAGISAQSEFLPGIERHLDCGTDITESGEALGIASGDSGSGTVNWAMYRIVMGNEQPGVVSADVNLTEMSDGNLSGYYIGLGNYGEGRWDWHGPFYDSHVRLSTAKAAASGTDYLSDLGNLFVCIAAYDGAVFDVVGISANAAFGLDTEAPPIPNGLFAIPVYGGIDLQWNDVIAGDLAGYRVYFGSADFTAVDEAGVQRLDYLVGQSSHLLTGLGEKTYVRVSAVDIDGNESALCDSVSQTPLGGNGPALLLATASASGLINDTITLSASGAVNYAWDLDGDGIFEVTGDTTGSQVADTTRTGIIRPNVRGTTEDGSCVATAAVSLIVTANSRPLANAYADPSAGDAPLLTTLTGSGFDDDGTIVSYSWDFDGDGTFDQTDATDPGPVEHTYTTPGFYNAKYRVEDNQGSWDIDTVGVLVNTPPNPANTAPTAVLTIGTGEESGDAPHSVHFDASGSSDPDSGDQIVRYWWDLDGDGMYEGATTTATYNYTYPAPGMFTAEVMVEDAHGATGTDSVSITVNVAGNDLPVADLTSDVTSGDVPLTVDFDAQGSSDSDGSIVRYDYDFDGDGNYEIYDGEDSPDYEYIEPGIFNATVRVTDDDGAQDTDTVTVDVNAPPVAEISCTHEYVEQSETCYFYSGNSHDSDGVLIDIQWDLDGDGVFNETGDEEDHQGLDTVGLSLSSSGVNDIGVEVMDNDGSRDSAVIQVIAAGWETMTVTTDRIIGTHCSMAVVAGRPAISFYDSTNADLMYVIATDVNGRSWESPDIVHSAGSVGKFNSLAVVDGLPAISYYDEDNGNLLFVRGQYESGVFGAPVTVDVIEDSGKYTCLLEINGYPAICYHDVTQGDLNYIRATSPSGSSWGAPVIIASSGISGKFNSMAIIDGYPAISFIDDSDGGSVKYIRADDANGDVWTGLKTVTAWKNNGSETSLTEVNGLPAILYYCSTDSDLYYTLGGSANGGSWTIQKTISATGSVGNYSSLIVHNGVPLAAYYHAGLGNLICRSASSATGSGTWADEVMIESSGDVGKHVSMVLVNGMPAVAYYDVDNGDLKYARLY